ncbi:hypothetical protein M569_00479 [Genlisea aurea]|uniref:M-phase phosphoprotein 6 n=1 Tax=Genlisea aurea TaxID=192259 RepID=S8D9R5_9LAMI|nr:hypothetical protein M569_00479 [Genlisea aurea]
MAKRELSSTLKNLKFMQRAAAKKEETKKEENASAVGEFVSAGAVRRCVVVYETDPHPSRGRMSFLNFNPSIDKLNGEEASSSHGEAKSSAADSARQSEEPSIRENGSSNIGMDELDLNLSSSNANANIDLKRKQVGGDPDTGKTIKLRKHDQDKSGMHPSSSSRGQFRKQHKRENKNWKVLLPPKLRHHGKK